MFSSRKTEGGQKIIDACQQMSSPDPVRLGTYRGFDLELSFNTMERTYEVKNPWGGIKDHLLGH